MKRIILLATVLILVIPYKVYTNDIYLRPFCETEIYNKAIVVVSTTYRASFSELCGGFISLFANAGSTKSFYITFSWCIICQEHISYLYLKDFRAFNLELENWEDVVKLIDLEW